MQTIMVYENKGNRFEVKVSNEAEINYYLTSVELASDEISVTKDGVEMPEDEAYIEADYAMYAYINEKKAYTFHTVDKRLTQIRDAIKAGNQYVDDDGDVLDLVMSSNEYLFFENEDKEKYVVVCKDDRSEKSNSEPFIRELYIAVLSNPDEAITLAGLKPETLKDMAKDLETKVRCHVKGAWNINMKYMIFKDSYGDVVFDSYTREEQDENFDYSPYWTDICPKCQKKYGKILGDRIIDGSSGECCCGVKGCDSKDADMYVDFTLDDVEFCDEL